MAKGDITHQECPFADCSSSDAFNYNPEGYGYCQSCRTSYPSKKPLKEWAKERYPVQEKETPQKVKEPTKATYKSIRGLDEDVAKLYGIQMGTDDDGNPVRYAFKYPSNVKYRDATFEPGAKKTPYWTKERGAIKELFGPDFNSGSSTRLYLTEGEFDAASLYQALGKTFPVKGLPGSGISEDFIKYNLKYLQGFKEIVYAGELDPAGRRCADKLFEVFAEKFWYIPLTKHKDANDFIRAGDSDELMWAARKPQRYTPENFFCSDDKMKQILEEENPYEYVPTGIKALDAKMRGLVKGGITFIKAPRGTGKCLHPDQKVLNYDGTFSAAKHVKVGDKLMGPDSCPRVVESTVEGKEEMFQIIPTKGDPWVCNRSHILAVYNHDKGYLNISVDDYLSRGKSFQDRCVLYRSDGVDFDAVEEFLEFDPYFVGLYLGDGSKKSPCITLGETKKDIVRYLYDNFTSDGYIITEEQMSGCIGYHITTGQNSKVNPVAVLRDELCGTNRHIPERYKLSSRSDRMHLLAGILDADGHYTCGGFDIVQKSEQLAKDICFVARSLGFAAYMKPTIKTIKSSGFSGNYFRISLSGDFSVMEEYFLRHTPTTRTQVKNALRTGFTVRSLGVGDYCGFSLSGNDRLFLLDDFTVTHNTEIARLFEMAMLDSEETRIALLHAEEPKSLTYRTMATYELGTNVRTREDAKWNDITEEQVYEASQRATKHPRTVIFEMRSGDDPMVILDYIRLAATVYGASFIFVDHIQRLSYLSATGVDGATSMLTALGARAAQLCKELNVGLVFISQVNDDGRTKYAAALEEEAIVCILLKRDTESEDEREQNTTTFILDKNRPFNKLGEAGKVFFNSETTILEEIAYDV